MIVVLAVSAFVVLILGIVIGGAVGRLLPSYVTYGLWVGLAVACGATLLIARGGATEDARIEATMVGSILLAPSLVGSLIGGALGLRSRRGR
jgi:fatty acid desaturase